MKKLHKTKLLLFLVALCTTMLFGCKEYEIDSQPVKGPNIQIDAMESYTALAVSPSNIVFNISANTPWSITSNQQWCKPSPAMSSSSSLVSEVVVMMEPNTGKVSRTAVLTIKADQVQGTRTITITQASKEELVVIPYDETVPTEGGNISFKIVSNKPWTITPSTLFVSNLDKKSGTGTEDGNEEVITLQIPANPGAKREGVLKVKTDFQEYTFKIAQAGIIIEQENDPTSTTIVMGGNGLTVVKTVNIRANKDWKVEVPVQFQSWITAEAISNTQLKITTTVSNMLSNRIGSVVLKTKDIIAGFDGVTFSVVQPSAFWRNGASSNFKDITPSGYFQMFGGGVASNYLFKKGKLIFDFESINLTSDSWIEFNMWTDFGLQPNFHLHFKPGATSNFTCGGALNYTQKTFLWTKEQINAVKKIEFIVDYKNGNANYLVLKCIIDGVEVSVLDNNILDRYKTNDNANYPGQTVWLKLNTPDGVSNFTTKSITWVPID